MRGNEQPHRRIVVVLILIAVLSPIICETETFGVGESVALDAVFYHSSWIGVCWAIEHNSSSTLIPRPDTFELLFSYISPINLIVWIIGILSPIISWLVLTDRIKLRRGLFVIALCAFLLALMPSINVFRVEAFYTYVMRPLFIPQIVCSLVLLWKHRDRIPILLSA
jgi:hypothetical protein